MLGRRQLREKAMQAIYAWKSSGEDSDQRAIEKNMLKGVDQIYDLYIYLLNLLNFQKEIAEHKIELAKNKNFTTEKDLNPNLKFVSNEVFRILDENEELNSYTSKNKQLSWDLLDSYPNNIYKEITASEEFISYMNNPNHNFNDDREFMMTIYENHIAPNESLHEWLEEQNIHWADDLYIANSMVMTTLKSFTPKSTGKIKLFKVYKDDDDKEFVIDLLRKTIRYDQETRKNIEEKAKNWELDRIAMLDLILLQMALTEFKYFHNIPPKATLNEYIELSKIYSTEKSKVFVNGILDRSMKEMNSF
ncbi:transcription antitermination factor NusB [Moheibacter sediminis]|uniref:NusB antitermination factor n=1 Tax=Moheibacter sediminis TaxID=1434700 RepID=A0A1W2CUH4_9FLAO|nr:transcription antitermination factor NusB [Moheibacter sediminis]SMC88552.1 NusB antitermination factor [Moheibacter sediminis]